MKKVLVLLLGIMLMNSVQLGAMEGNGADEHNQDSRRFVCPSIFPCLESTGEILSRSVLVCLLFLRGYGPPRSLKPSDCDRDCAWNKPKED